MLNEIHNEYVFDFVGPSYNGSNLKSNLMKKAKIEYLKR